jgi:hypothetical protein
MVNFIVYLGINKSFLDMENTKKVTKSKELNITEEEVLEQLFDKDMVIVEHSLAGRIPIKLKNLKSEDYLAIDKKIEKKEESKMSVYQKFGLHKLAYGIIRYNDLEVELDDPERAEKMFKKISGLPTGIVDSLLKKQDYLEKLIKHSIGINTIDSVFFEKGDSPQKPGESPEG